MLRLIGPDLSEKSYLGDGMLAVMSGPCFSKLRCGRFLPLNTRFVLREGVWIKTPGYNETHPTRAKEFTVGASDF